ncbi:hypothetical protein GCM10027411_19970 [Microbacterium aureliae]
MARLPQARHGAGDILGRRDGTEIVQQPQARGGEQGGQLGHLHRPSLCGCEPLSAGPADGIRPALALTLQECQSLA